MGFGQSKSCPTCVVCEDCSAKLAECDTCYDSKDDFCNDEVLGPLIARNNKELRDMKEDHKNAEAALDKDIAGKKTTIKNLNAFVSAQNTEIETLRRWLHCETSTDPLGYKKADNTYEEDFKGKPYWDNRLNQCNNDTDRYTAERENCDTWLGVCNDYLTPYCESAGDCGGWWVPPAVDFNRQGKQCTDTDAADAIALENPVLPQ